MFIYGFPNGSVGKESTCNVGDTGDLGLIPGSGRSPGGGNGNPLQHSCLKTTRTDEPGEVQFMRLQRIRCNLSIE